MHLAWFIDDIWTLTNEEHLIPALYVMPSIRLPTPPARSKRHPASRLLCIQGLVPGPRKYGFKITDSAASTLRLRHEKIELEKIEQDKFERTQIQRRNSRALSSAFLEKLQDVSRLDYLFVRDGGNVVPAEVIQQAPLKHLRLDPRMADPNNFS
ncbi:hypothetical protein K505DRAFT_340687 [Melanomma pulvis-pyrius CBS 109.77]|uniref:Uncharacterized protein n=1 Tax=Melanomma pulvis-pyrius CBS 109.77 TaxID=1314802 RepID=A0A6A6X2J4_9PLEO|nr:hypothetical protein K505DRAFT_340687 [Melanomma pulvis-pyrius CBS 109.77]